MFKKLLLSLVVVVTFSGCSATGPKFTQLESAEANKAKVYFYRPWAMLDGAAAPDVQVNGVNKFKISNGGYEILNLKAGDTSFVVKEGTFMSNWRAGELSINTNLEANKVYFIRLTAELTDAGYIGGVSSISGKYTLGLIIQDFAVKELGDTKKN
tara:strand:+ start:112 stop:576 length:465 start_codon:yes stop_codon:yes gene_type:complete